MNNDDLEENIKDQLAAQGCAMYKVSDGEVIIFSKGLLQKLLALDKELVTVFVSRGPRA